MKEAKTKMALSLTLTTRAKLERMAEASGVPMNAVIEQFIRNAPEPADAIPVRHILSGPNVVPEGVCGCSKCYHAWVDSLPNTRPSEKMMLHSQFIVCPECGNKRCPKATFHENPCGHSNEPGQIGSLWENQPAPSEVLRSPQLMARYGGGTAMMDEAIASAALAMSEPDAESERVREDGA